MLSTLLSSTAFSSALVFGFRHGFDWDHLAALTDLTGSQTKPRRSMWLATLYAGGHASMVLALGVVAILFAEQVPASVDGAMERLVGVSLILLGAWIVLTAVRSRGAPPLRSRWMLLIDGVRRLLERRRRSSHDRAGDVVVIEHAHPHGHDHGLHDHRHDGLSTDATAGGDAAATVVVQHSHLHRHVSTVPRDPFASYTGPSSFGIGLLHGIGAETPTQVLIFAAAANAAGHGASIGILVCFVVGLVAANTLFAAASTFGFRKVLAHRAVAVSLAVATAAFSLVVGTLLVSGNAGALPPSPGT